MLYYLILERKSYSQKKVIDVVSQSQYDKSEKLISTVEKNHKDYLFVGKYHESVEDSSKIAKILPLRVNFFLYALYILTSILSAGTIYVLSLFSDRLKKILIYSKSDIHSCSHLGIYGKDNSFTIVPIEVLVLPELPQNSKLSKICLFGLNLTPQQKLFKYKEFNYFYDTEKGSFNSIHFSIKATSSLIHKLFSEGLSANEILYQKKIFGICDIEIEVASVGKLVMKEFSDPFYVFQIFSIVLWLIELYFNYAAVLIATTLISVTIAIRETRHNLRNIQGLARYSCNINVFRQNEVD